MFLSIIVPAYNVEQSLRSAVESILSQEDLDGVEVLIVDDGASDQTPFIADQLAKESPIVRTFHKENGGLSSARNYGIQRAQGEYLTFLDSDDAYRPGLVRTFKQAVKEFPMDLFIFNFNRIENNQIVPRQAVNRRIEQDSHQALDLLFSYNGLDFYAWNKIWRKSLFEQIGFLEGYLYEDMVPSYLGARAANRVQATDFVGLNYYENPASIIAKPFSDRQFDNVRMRIAMLEDTIFKEPAFVDQAARRLLDGLLDIAYKLSRHPNKQVVHLYTSYMKDIYQDYRPYIEDSSDISAQKHWAWRLYQWSPRIYQNVFRWYLKK